MRQRVLLKEGLEEKVGGGSDFIDDNNDVSRLKFPYKGNRR